MKCNIDLAAGKDHTSILFSERNKDGAFIIQKQIALSAEETKALRAALAPGTPAAQPNWPGFETIIKWIKEMPLTMLPATLINVVRECYRKKVFKPGGLEECVNKILDKEDNK